MKNNNLKLQIKRIFSAFVTVAVIFGIMPFVTVNADYGYDLPWLWPVPGSFKINCLDYYYSGGLHNSGQCIDIGANGYTGSERLDIVSSTSGRVTYIQDKYNETTNRGSGWGNYVIVRSGNINIVYGHLKSVSCDYGEIKAGDVIGKMGNTGNSTGVHLHLQAYPVSENYQSTKIPVFEKFRTNPLYYEQFQFLKGLKDASVRYGEWISNYYKTSSGSYYKYSGGLELGIDTLPVSAKVTVINTQGAAIRSLPLSANSYITGTVSYDKKAEISGYYYDAYGALWLKLSDGGGWIKGIDVGFYDYNFSVSTDDVTYPKGEYGGASELSVGGIITSGNKIASYTVSVKQGAKVVASYTEEVGQQSVSLDGVMEKLDLITLNDGVYSFVLTVKEEATYPNADTFYNTHDVIISRFEIDEALSDKIPPLIEGIEFSSITPNGINLYCTASDNEKLSKVEITVSSADGTPIKSFDCRYSDGKYLCDIPSSELSGSGSYKITAVAYDVYGNSASLEKTVSLSQSSVGETWSALYALKVRSGAGLSYSHTGSISAKATFYITEVAEADGYVWGKHSKGWSPLIEIGADNLSTYVSGYLSSLSFDLNGGAGETPSDINKKYGESVIIPQVIPTREGYTFLGWAFDSNAASPEYQGGEEYSENRSGTLFAVWQDGVSPQIGSVTTSGEAWTKDGVTVTVTATDNDKRLFYSFDGGNSWQLSGQYLVRENTTLSAGTIIVRDYYGNIAVWQKEIKISNIDILAPLVENLKADLSISGTGVTVTFRGASDGQSGIAKYQLEYSINSDMNSSVVVDIQSGNTINLENGVYYWKLIVTDNVGNAAEKVFERFRVGEPERLSPPTEIKFIEDATTALVYWTASENADGYKIDLSSNEGFDELVTFTTSETKFTLTGLEAGKEYYVRIRATSTDGIYLTSVDSETAGFLTTINYNTLHGFASLFDAAVDKANKTASYTANYNATLVDLTAKVHESSTAEYFKDSELTETIIDFAEYSFTSSSETVYIKVTSPNGESSVYTFTITRAEKKAAAPEVNFIGANEEIVIGDFPSELVLTAESPDEGRIKVEWYLIFNGGEPEKIGEEFSVTPLLNKCGTYQVYAVVSNTNFKCQEQTTTVTTDTVSIEVLKKSETITVHCGGYNYNGSTPNPSVSGYNGDGEISYKYFSDSECQNEISAPVDAGVYYVKAYAAETDTYAKTSSEAARFVIEKANNDREFEFTVKNATVRDENGYIKVNCDGIEYRLQGSEVWSKVSDREITVLGGETVELRFAETENYKAGSIVETIEVEAYTGATEIKPKSSSGDYVKDGYLFVNSGKNTAEALLDRLENRGGVNIYSQDGELLNLSEAYVISGATIKIEDSEGVYLSLTVIILGDIDGDGEITRQDAEFIMYLSNGMAISESELDLILGDIDGDGRLTSADAYLTLLKI